MTGRVQPGGLTYHPVACSSVNAGRAIYYHRQDEGCYPNRQYSPYAGKVRRGGGGTWYRAQNGSWWDMRMRGDECSDLEVDTGCDGCVTVAAAVTRGGLRNGCLTAALSVDCATGV